MVRPPSEGRIPEVTEESLLNAFYAVAAADGWRGVTLSAVAERAGIPVARVAERFADRHDFLAASVHRADREMLKGVTGADEAEPFRERLFDLVMRRLDALAPHKDGVAAIVRGLRGDPSGSVQMVWSLHRSMIRLLEAAGISTRGLRGKARAQGMLAIWVSVLQTWLDDDSTDSGRTMKALDKALDRAEGVDHVLSMCLPTRSRRKGEPPDDEPISAREPEKSP